MKGCSRLLQRCRAGSAVRVLRCASMKGCSRLLQRYVRHRGSFLWGASLNEGLQQIAAAMSIAGTPTKELRTASMKGCSRLLQRSDGLD